MAKQERLTCLICNGVFPNREWLDAHYLYESNEIVEGWFGEVPKFAMLQSELKGLLTNA